jgi:hypothetical protein
MTRSGGRLSAFALVAFIVVALAAIAFGVGYLLGKLLL